MGPKIVYRCLQLVVLAGSLGLTACVTPTPYQPATDGYGYAEQSLEEDRYRVVFNGNSLTPRETVENYLLYRAAEVTLARGYDYFVVVGKETERDTTYHSTGTGIGTDYFDRHHAHGVGAFGSATSRPSSRYSALANIIIRKGKKSPDNTAAYDARDVLKRLAPTITRKPTS
jgi:hypothetical protein